MCILVLCTPDLSILLGESLCHISKIISYNYLLAHKNHMLITIDTIKKFSDNHQVKNISNLYILYFTIKSLSPCW